jgi:hypothetical protein
LWLFAFLARLIDDDPSEVIGDFKESRVDDISGEEALDKLPRRYRTSVKIFTYSI